MWLVLCPACDLTALWVHARLRERLGAGVELVTEEALASALRWNHWLSGDDVGFEVELADGRRLDSRRVHGTLNRTVQCRPAHLALAAPDDREYAEQEFSALFLSVLASLPEPMFNRPTPQGLAGAWRHPTEWAWRAADAGLPTERLVLSSENTLDPSWGWHRPFTRGRRLMRTLVVGSRVLGSPDPQLEPGCLALTRSVGTGVLGIDFEAEGDRIWFHGATPMPELRAAGQACIDALVDAFTHATATDHCPGVEFDEAPA